MGFTNVKTLPNITLSGVAAAGKLSGPYYSPTDGSHWIFNTFYSVTTLYGYAFRSTTGADGTYSEVAYSNGLGASTLLGDAAAAYYYDETNERFYVVSTGSTSDGMGGPEL